VIALPKRAVAMILQLALAGALGACSTPTASSIASSTPTPSQLTTGPTPSARPAGAEPGRPYNASDVLAAMRESRRPGGVAEQLQTDEIADAVASFLWTWDGEAWANLAVGGSCGPEACTLEVTGSTAGLAGADAYSFAIVTDGPDVRVVDADLHGYPTSLEADLEAIVLAGVPASRLDGLALVGARWLPPPDAGRYVLAYRSGGEEGSPGLDVVVDLPGGEVLSVTEIG
jgi:hypothetical protein